MTVQAEVKEPDTKLADKTDTKQPESLKSEPQKPPEETQEQINWRKFRQEREKERREKQESDRRAAEKEAEATALKAAMESLLNKPQIQQNYVDPVEETEEQRIAKQVNKALEEREKSYLAERRRQEASELPQKLKSTFNDFDQVTSQENIDYLQFHYPEVYAPYKDAPATFDTYANFYKALKKFVPNTDTKKDQAKIEKNLNKPQSMSSPGITQTGDQAPSKGLDEKRRQDNWNRMNRIMKGLGPK